MENKVFVSKCENYEEENVYNTLKKLLLDNNLLDFVYPGINIAIKANLVAPSKPSSAVVTHPALLIALCKILIELKANVVVGDSPGGLFNDTVLNAIYHKTNVNKVEEVGAKLNHDFSQEIQELNGFKVVKNLDCTSYLLKADAIINFAKMKTHGMMSLSGSVKNMFGAVPGTIKLEYHYRYPNHQDFANMLIDIQEFYKCKLHIVDAIEAMEGNGPTMGTPRKVNLLMASKSCFSLDVLSCKIMNLPLKQVPTIQEAIDRNLSVSSFEQLDVNMDIAPFIIEDFKNIEHNDTIQFYNSKGNIFKKVIGKLAKSILLMRPKAKKDECIGCKKCADICPAKAIKMVDKKPVIDKKSCIRCFCCQEFCPVGAMKTHRTLIARIITRKKTTSK